mmetsp:Transcript_10421/g.11949  ORF Transcript_10421/g.11949 Transcript_10421/m.11949 type:complete len:116 (-) Transcript_10421:480-827(-)
MGRISSFLGGVIFGGSAYAAVSLWSQSELSRIDHQVRSIHFELGGDSAEQPQQVPKQKGVFETGPLADFRDDAVDAFRKKWNHALRSSIDTVHSALKPKVVIVSNEMNDEDSESK